MTIPCDPNILPDNCNLKECCGIDTKTKVIETSGTPLPPPTITPPTGAPTIIKVPRWLKRVVISGCIKSTLDIPGYFSEIKDIRKKVIITQAKLILNELIVEGYILKDIKYVSPHACPDGTMPNTGKCKAYVNDWHDISEKVPFSLCMTVPELPVIYPSPNTSQQVEYNYLCDTMSQQCCDKGYMAPSPCETLRVETNYLNERPYAELVGYRIAELDLNMKACHEPCAVAAPQYQCLYDSLTEKIKLDIVLDLYVLGFAQSAAPTVPITPQPPYTGVCPSCNNNPLAP